MQIDSLEEIKKLDSKSMLGSIEKLADQAEEIISEAQAVVLPPGYENYTKIVFFGMGGSSLGAHCIKSIFLGSLKVPFEIFNGYGVPASVDKNTIAFIVSYSGGTEEALSNLKGALDKKAKVIIVTSGDELGRQAIDLKLPALIFGTKNNPCGSPRMGLGYTLVGPLLLLRKLGAIRLEKSDFEKMVSTIRKYQSKFGVEIPEQTNFAKQLARKALAGNVWFIGSEHLAGNAHVAANQMNENAKRFASYFVVPELNHHLLEGLRFIENHDDELFVFVESTLYDSRIQKRFSVTKEVIKAKNIPQISYQCREESPFLQSLEVLVLSSYTSFYAAMLEDIDPTAIPMVDFLKASLKK